MGTSSGAHELNQEFGSDSVFAFVKFTREVKVVRPYFIVE